MGGGWASFDVVREMGTQTAALDNCWLVVLNWQCLETMWNPVYGSVCNMVVNVGRVFLIPETTQDHPKVSDAERCLSWECGRLPWHSAKQNIFSPFFRPPERKRGSRREQAGACLPILTHGATSLPSPAQPAGRGRQE